MAIAWHGYCMAFAYFSHLPTKSLPQGLQRQISFEEQRGRERIAGLAESTRRSLSDQQRRLQAIAGQGMTRIQQTRDEGISKIASAQAAAVQVRARNSPFQASAQAVWLSEGSPVSSWTPTSPLRLVLAEIQAFFC